MKSAHSLDFFLQRPHPSPWSTAWHSLCGFQEFSLNTKDRMRSTKEEHTTVSIETATPSERPGGHQVSRGTSISSIDKCLIGHFEDLVSCMQMQMFEGLFAVQLEPDRLQCQASTQPPIILLGSASKDVSGLSGPCKFPHPQAPLCFQS